MRRCKVATTDGVMILENRNVRHSEQISSLVAFHIIDMVGTAIRGVHELAHQRKPGEDGIIIPKGLRRLFPRVHQWAGEIRHRGLKR